MERLQQIGRFLMMLRGELAIAIAYLLAGNMLKLADFYGEDRRRTIAYILATITGILFSILLTEDTYSAAIILGIIFGVSLSGKVDRPNLQLGLLTVVLLSPVFGLIMPDLIVLASASASAFVDERLHDRLRRKNPLQAFFRRRMVLKTAVVVLHLLGRLPLAYAICFFAFDIAYDLTGLGIERRL